MTVTVKKLAQSTLNVSASVATLVTGVTGGHTEITSLWLYNDATTSRTVTLLAHGTGTSAVNVLTTISVDSKKGVLVQLNNTPIILNATETLRAYQDTGTDVTCTVYGIEEV